MTLSPIIPYARACADAYHRAPDWTIGPVVRANVLNTTDGVPLLAFPGTRPDHAHDDLADLDVGPLDIGGGQLVHIGFTHCAQLVLPAAVSIAANSIDLTGHSLGAAIAVELATLLTIAGVKVDRVVGFGCPRTAIGPWQSKLLADAGVEVVLYRHGADPVPHLPSTLLADWQWGGTLTQLGSDSIIPSIADHDMAAGYLAALTAA